MEDRAGPPYQSRSKLRGIRPKGNKHSRLTLKVAADLRAAIIVEVATDKSGPIPERLHRSVAARRSAATILNTSRLASVKLFLRRSRILIGSRSETPRPTGR